MAKGDWLLLIEPGAKLGEGWTNAVVEHVATSGAAARFSQSAGSRRPFLARLFRRDRPLASALVITKRQAAALVSKAANSAAMARGVSPRRLEAKISVAPPKR